MHDQNIPPVITKIMDTEGGKIFQITINRPEVYNCVNAETSELLLQAWQKFKEDDSLIVAVLHGAGDQSFCSGADLKALNGLVDIHAREKDVNDYVKNGTGPMGGTRIVHLKPVITVSQGYTYAGGLELYCHGHIRLAEENATFSVSCRRWGVPLADGGTVYLPRFIGMGAALPLIITGQKITAQRAYELGLVWELTPNGAGLNRALDYAKQICAQPKDALFADLSSAINGYHLSMTEALQLEAKGIHPVVRSESIKEGVEKFINGDRSWFK